VTSPAAGAPAVPALRVRGIRKAFPGVVALDGVDLEVHPGEVLALLGENGAGKSTLMKILSGALPKDDGEIEVAGQVVHIRGPRHARELGVRIIYQEFNLVPHLAVAENIVLGREPTVGLGFVDRGKMAEEARHLLSELGIALDPWTPVRELGVAQQQMVEVAKALSGQARVLIMDEPTSALSESEIRALFAAVQRLTEKGVGVIYISHRLEEVAQVAHRVTVLRDGRHVGTGDARTTPIPELVRMMAGRELTSHYPRRRSAPGEELLRAEGVGRGRALTDVSLVLRRGEVLGVAGLLGAGRTELARVLTGVDRPEKGRVVIRGQAARLASPGDAMRRGIALLPEDRKTQGLVLGLSVGRNLALPSVPWLSRLGFVQEPKERELAERQVGDLHIKTPGLDQRAAFLSGGNQQKIVLGKWLATNVEVLVMDEPTRGIDVAAKVEIYELMNRLTDSGKAILMISSELPEVLGMSDRILVMHRGKSVAEIPAAEATQERVLAAALGQTA
jgi:ribose transport system ATP-binding protein